MRKGFGFKTPNDEYSKKLLLNSLTFRIDELYSFFDKS
jgi:hypothetical protein